MEPRVPPPARSQPRKPQCGEGNLEHGDAGAVSRRSRLRARSRVRDPAVRQDVQSHYRGPSLGDAKRDSVAGGASCSAGAGDGARGRGATGRPRCAAAALGVRGALTSN